MAIAGDIVREKYARTFEEAIGMTGFGKFNLLVLLATGSCLMSVIIETMCAMFITPAAQCDLNLTLSQKGLLYSISFLGVVSSSHLWGFIADTRGRRNVLVISLVSSAFVSFICSIVSLPWLFILLRFVNGFLIGGSSAIVYAFAGEFHGNLFRPKVVTWIATFVAFGNMYLPGLAWAILPQSWSFEISFLNIPFKPWRLLMIIYAIPSLISALFVLLLPESPRYLMTQGKSEQALVILKRMFVVNMGKSEDEYAVSSILWDESIAEVQHGKRDNVLKSMWEQTVPLFNRKFIVKTILVCFLQFALFLSTSTVIMWYPQILNSVTIMSLYGKDEDVTMCKSILHENNGLSYEEISKRAFMAKPCNDVVESDVFLISLIVGFGFAVCYLFIGAVINIFGKKKLLVGLLTVATACGLCAQLLSGSLLIKLSIGVFLMAGTCIGILNAVVVDLYPTEIRGMALAVSLMFGRFGAMTGSNIGGPLMYSYCDYMFYIFTALHILIVIVIALLPSNEKAQKGDAKELS